VTSGWTDVATGRYAVTSEDVELETDGSNWVIDDVLGTARLEVRSADGHGTEIFLGVARTPDAQEYLRGVGQARLDEIGPGWNGGRMGPGSMDDIAGGAPADPPVDSDIWVAETSGPGTQVLDWRPADGNWTVVVMRADGARGIDVEARAGPRRPVCRGWPEDSWEPVPSSHWSVGSSSVSPSTGRSRVRRSVASRRSGRLRRRRRPGPTTSRRPLQGSENRPDPTAVGPSAPRPGRTSRPAGPSARIDPREPPASWNCRPPARTTHRPRHRETTVVTQTERPIDPPTDGGAAGTQRIVVGVDGSPGARLALAWALSAAPGRGADLLVLCAFPVEAYWLDPYFIDPRRVGAIREDTEARARGLVQEVLGEPGVSAVAATAEVPVHVVAVPGAAAPSLVQHSASADLLVVGSRGRGGIRSTMLGSVALHCAAHAECPVVVVHPAASGSAPEGATAPRVVVGLDDSPHARGALVTALAEAGRRGARLEAVLAYEEPNYWSDMYAVMTPPPGQSRTQALERAESLVAEVLGANRTAVDAVVGEGPAGETLVRHAAGAELLVVGSRSRSTLPGMVLGSVALHCVVHATCPVMVVRPTPAPAQAAAAVAAEPAFLG